MKILYTSTEVHSAIKHVLEQSTPTEKRVALVAFVGEGAEAYLPDPDKFELVCCLQPGATSAQALERLQKRGAIISKADRLHMKVYWSSVKGCVICSANASTNALGKGGLKEAGVLLPPGVVEIGKLLQEAKAAPITSSDLRHLKRESDRLAAAIGGIGRRPAGSSSHPTSFVEWYESSSRANWKLGWWEEDTLETASAAKLKSLNTFGINAPRDAVNFAKGQVAKGDWLLRFKLPEGTEPDWMHVDFVIQVPLSDKKAYEPAYPYQAIQVRSKVHYPTPPFDIDSRNFRRALKKAVAEFGYERLVNSRSVRPPAELLKKIKYNLT